MASDLPDIEAAGPAPIEAVGESTVAPAKAMSALWYRLANSQWRTLAVVAPGNGPGAWRIAQALFAVAEKRPRLLKAVNAIDASLERMAAVAHVLSPAKLVAAADRTRFVLAVDSPLENPAAIGLLSTCEAVVLLLERRRTRIPDAQRILELIGRERFIGAVLGGS
ncbi:MAG TPA: hypothetical protein VFF12_08325 [Myxococcaceae bacterium]|nr:hypothetical protein [Myxococcaceae bacterium]